MKYKLAVCCAVGLLLLLSGCGPSPEEIATMTASAWTPTPPPTSTPVPTPIPYDLTVTVTDETGAPIPGAEIVFPESGDGSPIPANDQGQFSWTDLPGEAVSLTVSAQGYLVAEQSTTIQRGSNEVTVALQRDPYGLLPAEACASDQKVLYVEDFQDGQAQDWDDPIQIGIDGNMPNGWSLLEEDGNKVLLFANAPEGTHVRLQNHTFDNFVWHAKYKVIGADTESFFMWRISQDAEATRRYVVAVGAQNKPWMIRFFDTAAGPNPMNTGQASGKLAENQWYNFDIAYFDGLHQVWVDGKKIIEYQDSQPYPEGTIGLEAHLNQSMVTQFFFDDFVVCELTAPYAPPQ
ncbi:MAG: carboxypeptidase regulatory-like domain-containing protein [Chloroflexota bacterium]